MSYVPGDMVDLPIGRVIYDRSNPSLAIAGRLLGVVIGIESYYRVNLDTKAWIVWTLPNGGIHVGCHLVIWLP